MNEDWEYIDFLNAECCGCSANCYLYFKINDKSHNDCLDLRFNYLLRKLNILVLVPFK